MYQIRNSAITGSCRCKLRRWGSLQLSPDPLAGFKGPTSKGREGREGGEGREGRGKEKERGGKGKTEDRRRRSPCSDFTI